MKKTALFAFLLFFFEKNGQAQQFIDSAFAVVKTELAYGTATDFAGTPRELKLDLALPVGDAPPACGRPLFIAIHGGAFLGGSRKDAVQQFWIQDFAERGYAAASIEYRLGMFQTPLEVHCNVTQLFGTPWDCLNMADSGEWHRGHLRAVQDVRAAIRFLVNNKAQFNIDPQNVFVAGESAGGFTALGVGFLDDEGERSPFCAALPDAAKPNPVYENTCIQAGGFAPSIAAMDRSRPDLGPVDGALNQPSVPYRIRAVANFFGAMLADWFDKTGPAPMPALYLFHQPNDIIVPFATGRVLDGYAFFFSGFPFNCSNIINRPTVIGSKSIAGLVAARAAAGKPVPELTTTFTQNSADGWAQIADPYKCGHCIDNYALRTAEIVNLFASKMGACTSAADGAASGLSPKIYPNPTSDGRFFIETGGGVRLLSVEITGAGGRLLFSKNNFGGEGQVEIRLPDGCPAGVFFVKTRTGDGAFVGKLIVE